ncbi:MAG: STAS domain-containing protein [Deltaproteobacteria bacterium]|nr:STAS domain-containing protein [Deltaproteobacteria bacterium]
MAARKFEVQQEVDGAYAFSGEMTIHDLEYLKEFLDSVGSRTKKVFISLQNVRFIDTASLQLLIAFRKSLGKKGELSVTAVSPEVEKILEVSGLKSHVGLLAE